jgi:anti-sigma B factor antagonist
MDGGASQRGFQVSASRINGYALVSLLGEFDLAGVTLFEQELDRVHAPDATLVVDLRGLTFIDSSGLRALVIADQEARSAGGRCVVVRGSEQVGQVLELTGIGERLELVDDLPGLPSQPQAASG